MLPEKKILVSGQRSATRNEKGMWGVGVKKNQTPGGRIKNGRTDS